MKARFYTLLFAILPRRWQWKLWNYLSSQHGYRGQLTSFRDGTYSLMGTPKLKDDLYGSITPWFEDIAQEEPYNSPNDPRTASSKLRKL